MPFFFLISPHPQLRCVPIDVHKLVGFCKTVSDGHTKERPAISTVKHNILDIFFDNGKRSGLYAPPSRTSSGTTVWCFTLNVIPSPKSCQMGVMCREHCMISHILMRNEYNKPLPSCGKYSTGAFDPSTYTLNYDNLLIILNCYYDLLLF